jgi:hypothetical protein
VYFIYICRCKCKDLDLEGGLDFLKYAINIEKGSLIYLSPVQKEHAKRKWLDLEVVLSGFLDLSFAELLPSLFLAVYYPTEN